MDLEINSNKSEKIYDKKHESLILKGFQRILLLSDDFDVLDV